MCCRLTYLLSLLQISPTVPFNSYVTARSARSHFPSRRGPGLTRLTVTLTTSPCWCGTSRGSPHARGMDAGTPTRSPRSAQTAHLGTLVVPPWPLRSCDLQGLHKWGLDTHASNFRVRGWAEDRRKSGEDTAQRTERCRGFPPSPSDPSGVTRVQILHLLGNGYAPGLLFQTSQETQWGRGSCGLGHNTDPRTFLEDKRGFDGRKSSGHRCPLTSKANDKKATVNQLVLRKYNFPGQGGESTACERDVVLRAPAHGKCDPWRRWGPTPNAPLVLFNKASVHQEDDLINRFFSLLLAIQSSF